MSVQAELTADQTIRQEALNKAVAVHTNVDDYVADPQSILKTAEAFAEFVKNATVPDLVS